MIHSLIVEMLLQIGATLYLEIAGSGRDALYLIQITHLSGATGEHAVVFYSSLLYFHHFVLVVRCHLHVLFVLSYLREFFLRWDRGHREL